MPAVRTPRRDGFPGLAMLAVVGAMASLAVGTSLAKPMIDRVGSAGTTAYRAGFAALILVTIWRPWRRRLTGGDVLALLLYGASLGVMNLLFYAALRTVPFGLAVALEFTGPLAVAVLSSRRASDFAWVGLAATGLAILLPIGAAGRIDPAGGGLALGAGLCWALYIVFGQRVGGRMHGGQATALGMAVAACVAIPTAIVEAGGALLDGRLIGVGLGVAVLSSAVPYSLEMYALARLPRRTFSVILSVEPALAALAGLAMLHERLTLAQWVAIGCVVTASIGSAANARGDPPPPTVD